MRPTALQSSTLLLYSRPPPRLWTIPKISSPASSRASASQSRTLFDASSIFSAALGPCALRTLSHTKTLSHSADSIFRAVSDIKSYPQFLPFAISSSVLERDPTTKLPTRASLKVGYEKFGLEETWNSIVICNPRAGTIEARSSEDNSEGLFETLQTRWEIQASPTPSPSPKGQGDAGRGVAGPGTATTVRLDVAVRFRNPLYDQMFAQVEGQVASAMVSAFEARVQALEEAKDETA